MYERDTDAELLRAFRENPDFSQAFISLLGINDQGKVQNAYGQARHLGSTGSIDLEVRYESGLRVLIENKINAGYSVTAAGESQPERYRRTINHLREQGIEAFSVLAAPSIYINSSKYASDFCKRISYENLSQSLDTNGKKIFHAAILTAETPYEAINNHLTKDFFATFQDFTTIHFPDLILKKEPNYKGDRPIKSRTIYFDIPKTLVNHKAVSKPRMSLQCWDDNSPSASVKIMLGDWGKYVNYLPQESSLKDIGAYLRPAGRSLGIVIDTPRLETQESFSMQAGNVSEALESALRLQFWWNNNSDILKGWATLIAC